MMRENKLIIAGGVLLVLILGISVAVLVVITIPAFNKDKEWLEIETVSTYNGRLRGRLHRTFFDNKQYYAFKGIPYAKPPLQELRFKPPQRADQWNGVRDAFEFGNECVQDSGSGSEDCLFVNVYTPNVKPEKLLPVVIVIHGGSFYAGSGNIFGPDFLLNEEDVVVVTLNYRLGPFGFLSLNTTQYSGNMGLKDQLLAIKWTNENIYNFGGNRLQITLYGMSAGSASAHLHVLSPASKGLFQRAILASGAANCPWAISQESQVPGLFEFAASMGRPNLSMEQLIEFLQTVDAHRFAVDSNRQIYISGTERKEFSVFYAPVVEPFLSYDAFLEESPMRILESDDFVNDVDVMFGVASGESYTFIDDEMRDPTLLEPFERQMEIQFPLYEMNYNVNYSSDIYKEITQRIRNYYFELNPVIGRDTMSEYATLISDVALAYGIDRSARRHAAKSSARTYYYRFSVDAAFNLYKSPTVANTYDLTGSTHGDEHYYTFGAIEDLRETYNSVPADSVERRLIKQMSSMYTNFIAYGNPTPGNVPVYFEPVRVGEHNYLDIGNDYTRNSKYPNGFNPIFWENLFAEFNMW